MRYGVQRLLCHLIYFYSVILFVLSLAVPACADDGVLLLLLLLGRPISPFFILLREHDKKQIEKSGARRTETWHPRGSDAGGQGRPRKEGEGEHEGGFGAGPAVHGVDGEVSRGGVGAVVGGGVGGSNAIALDVAVAVSVAMCALPAVYIGGARSSHAVVVDTAVAAVVVTVAAFFAA